jgi:threonine/homoserine/homoserine lactone efflux protein
LGDEQRAYLLYYIYNNKLEYLMSVENFTALILFAFVSSITPGPNNLMLLASGINFGWQRSLAHMFGIGLGFTLMVMLVGLGIGQVFIAWPWLYGLLQLLGSGYLLWLAWGLLGTKTLGPALIRSRPMRFLEAAAFQWVNPKAWTMCIYAIATYSQDGQHFVSNALWIALAFGAVGLPCISLWAVFGSSLSRWLQVPTRLRRVNVVMALLLLSSLWPNLTALWHVFPHFLP